MIKDLELLKYPERLLTKKCVIWGAGKKGKLLYNNLLKLGIEDESLVFCDSSAELYKKENLSKTVLTVKEMRELVSKNRCEYMIVISVELLSAQDEIIEQIKQIGLDDLDVYTLYGVIWGIIFAKRKIGVEIPERSLGVKNRGVEVREKEELEKQVDFFMLTPYLETLYFIYQPGKVGSTAIWTSMESSGVHSLQVHTLKKWKYIRAVMKKKKTKIISAIRNPLEWKISYFWQVFEARHFDNPDSDYWELERILDEQLCVEREFRWFDYEMNEVIGIDVFSEPFDRERGYTIIKKGNIELLMFVFEKLNTLEDVIGDFVGIKDFQLKRENIGNKKGYRFAYEQYMKEFEISRSVFDNLCKDERLGHFYTSKDIECFREKWKKHVVSD